jgi:hypothetical protein
MMARFCSFIRGIDDTIGHLGFESYCGWSKPTEPIPRRSSQFVHNGRRVFQLAVTNSTPINSEVTVAADAANMSSAVAAVSALMAAAIADGSIFRRMYLIYSMPAAAA